MKPKQLFTFLLLFSACTALAQNTITVDNSLGANADYSDLQPAINFANPNDIIYVHASETSYGQITIGKPLTIIGFGHSNPDKNTFLDDIILNDGSDGLYLSGLYIDGDIEINSDNFTTLNNLVFENNRIISAIVFDGPANNVLIRGNVLGQVGRSGSSSNNYTNTIITNNILRRANGALIYLKNHESVVIRNNIFLYGGGIKNQNSSTGNVVVQNSILYTNYTGSWDFNDDGVLFENCLTYNPNQAVAILNGDGNWDNTNPNFVYVNDDVWNPLFDFHFQIGSVAFGAGVNGEDLGVFDGSTSFLFNNYGFTAGIPTVTITAITEQVAPGGTVEVTIHSNSN